MGLLRLTASPGKRLSIIAEHYRGALFRYNHNAVKVTQLLICRVIIIMFYIFVIFQWNIYFNSIFLQIVCFFHRNLTFFSLRVILTTLAFFISFFIILLFFILLKFIFIFYIKVSLNFQRNFIDTDRSQFVIQRNIIVST